MFKRQVARPSPVDFDTRVCDKFQFNRIRDMSGAPLHHLVKLQESVHRLLASRFLRCKSSEAHGYHKPEGFLLFRVDTVHAFASESDASFAYLVERKYHPRQQIDCLPDENHITGKSIAGCVF